MTSLDKAIETQLNNIQKKTGMSLKELSAYIRKSGLTKHGEIRDMLKQKLGLGHGDAEPWSTMCSSRTGRAPPRANQWRRFWTRFTPAPGRAFVPSMMH